jgi:hypothetical protein
MIRYVGHIIRSGGWVKAIGVNGPRRVVALERGRIYICRNDEYLAATNEGREPLCVGFRPELVSPINAQRKRV